ncbi:condensation domain-containing protein, partial [Cribrihabitans neustonicus]|uniref:condensation domain-containing protein n=1 Tax=Cribrihabitans neustonicus TaxID=1429085 RepID=UPI003B5B4461
MTETASEEIGMDLWHPMPLTPIQKGIWATTRMGADHSSAYNMPYCFELRGRLDVDALDDAVQAVGRRYPQLTSRVTTELGELHFKPSDQPIPFVVHQVDPPDASADAGMDLIESLANYAFDLGHEGPSRVDVVALSDDHHLLSVLVHHVVFDGASAALFFDALSEAFASGLDGAGEVAPEVGFVTYA